MAVLLTVTNTGLESNQVGSDSFKIRDSQGRVFDLATDPLSVQFAARDTFKRSILYTTIQPSLSDDEVFVFDIAPDATNLVLVPGRP